ncbi:MAG: heme-binding domain-containing protein [Acidobacteriales bacterium]|nr:heme-binding domain-containing protein [Terriglobales bacterium]
MNPVSTFRDGKPAAVTPEQLAGGADTKKSRTSGVTAWIKAASVLGGLTFAILQVVPGPPRTNPPVVPGHTIGAQLRMNQQISATLRKACMDCHSHETRWPWYSHVAPMSWHIAEDVTTARKAMNFSEWSTGAGRTPASAVGILAAACANVKSGRMPLPRYLLLHPEARLTEQEKDSFCEWTNVEIARILSEKHKSAAAEAEAASAQGKRGD